MTVDIKSLIKKVPGIRGLLAERDSLRARLEALTRFAAPGHFYSPIPSAEDISRHEGSGVLPTELPGINLREAAQRRLLDDLLPFYAEIPFQPGKTSKLRYYFDNPAYSYSDAIFLYCMIRFLKPARIMEVGSGFSSCLTLDTNDLHFGGAIAITFVEPYPELLATLLSGTEGNSRIIACKLQDVDLSEFDALAANDILFIDSTHVSKVSSDVNRILFQILPRLSRGVYVHFHDVMYPFEYPLQWLLEGRAWNEAYLLRAFLQYNDSFEIVLMNTFMQRFHETFFRERMPLCLRNPGGSIWLRKVGR